MAGIIRLRDAGATASYGYEMAKIRAKFGPPAATACPTGEQERFAGPATYRGMNSSETDGLGLSVLIYVTAILGGLAVMALPVYMAVKPTVYDNPPLVRADPLLNGPVIGSREVARAPLAVLKHRTIVDPKVVAALNAKIKQPESRRAAPQVAQRESRQRVAEVRQQPQRPTSFFQLLFGG